ncbi:lysozyme inhibitor LprI family protein [Pontixanthobacter sp. CEM42]|uniref:lysozyme inhibitor LprI family protein n=1 Tax=Pontixanthobacter sp. CEM42 TaxID=2792077 RepID=UPI001ADEEA4A|nr:lysozyme inhibitor LprI family protein [Pontixanthobacter sp. CEM42]
MIVELLLLARVVTVAPHPDWNCNDPLAQQEMNYCAHQDYLAADAELNAQWSKTSAILKERDAQWMDGHGNVEDDKPGFFQTALDAQRAWIIFRDAHCRSEGYYARGGSLEPLLVSTCKTKLTKDRTQQLQFLIEQ